jgi:hypothetical protein
MLSDGAAETGALEAPHIGRNDNIDGILNPLSCQTADPNKGQGRVVTCR